MRFLIAVLAFFGMGTAVATAADYSSWEHRQRITFTGYTQTEALVQFPVMVPFSNSATFDYGQFLSGSNADLRFTDESLTNPLNFEIENWDTNGFSVAWVQTPRLAGPWSTIYAFWGKADQEAPPCTTNGAVWDASDVGVWHMAQASARDSTSNRFHGTAVSNVFTTPGLVGGAQSFKATNDYITIPDNPRFTLSGNFTLSAWIHPNTRTNYQAIMGTYSSGTTGFIYCLNNTTANYPMVWGGGLWRSNFTSVVDSNWTHVAYTRTGTAGVFYVNGRISGTIANAVAGTDGGALQLGGGGGPSWAPYRWDGKLDEMRIALAVRSPAYMWASFMNQASNALFAPQPAAGAPFIRNLAPALVQGTNATLQAFLEATDPATVTVYFGTNDAGYYGTWARAESLPAPQSGGTVSIPVGDLLTNQVYYYTLGASNESGAFLAVPSLSFRTFGPPVLGEQPGATSLTYRTAVLRGTLLDGATATVSAAWGETPETLTNWTASAAVALGSFSLPLDGLSHNTAYYYRTFASNDYGTAWAPSVSAFTTRLASLVWTGAGANSLASNPTNWSTGLAPLDYADIRLDGTSGKSMTWDLTNSGVLQSWEQTAAYTGTVTLSTRFPGQGSFSNLLILGDCTVNGGVWTHPANTGGNTAADRLSVTVDGSFTLGPAARINVNNRGFAAGQGPGAGNNVGNTATTGRGASHGGQGTKGIDITNNLCYGFVTAPEAPGSGGAIPGGGAVRLVVGGSATIDGILSSCGAMTNSLAGSAGGSVYLYAGSIAGTGLVEATGSTGYWSGAGGRISLVSTSGTSQGTVACRAFSGPPWGYRSAPGTIFRSVPGAGGQTLLIDSFGGATTAGAHTELPSPLETYATPPAVGGECEDATLIITNSGNRVRLSESLRIGDFAWLAGGSVLDLNGYTLFIKATEPAQPFPQSFGGGTILTNGGRIIWGDAPASFRFDVTNGTCGSVSFSPESPDFYYAAGAVVTLTAVPDPGCAFLWWEGDVPAGAARTDNPLPVTANQTILLRALFATNDVNSRTWTGDGADALASTPANWFPAEAPTNGNRIIFNSNSRKVCTWNLNITPSHWLQDEGYEDAYSTIDGYKGWITVQTRFPDQGAFSNLVVTGDVILKDGLLTHPANTGGDTASDRLSLAVNGNFLLASNAVVNVTGRGYASLRGPGAGNAGQRSQSSGKAASHGGNGGHDANLIVGACYDSPIGPEWPGSGAAPSGGGVLRLMVEGDATLDGTILANGNPAASTMNPGSAGGSIFIRAGTVAGGGLLEAAGSMGYWTGGGGRIALVATNGSSLGTVTCRTPPGALPNLSPARGAAGTVYLETAAEGPGYGRLIIDSQGSAPMAGTYTELPPEIGPYPVHPAIGGWLENVNLIVTNAGTQLLMPQSARIGNFTRHSSGSALYLNGCTLFVKAAQPPLPFPQSYGNGTVVTNSGQILWGDQPATARVNATNSPGGTVVQSPEAANHYYPFGQTVELTAVPAPGCAFLWWVGDLPAGSNRTSNPLAIVVSQTAELTALFATNDAASRTWTGDATTTLASNPTNWFPAAVPVSGNTIIFNSTSVKNCTWDLDIEPAEWRQELGYADSYDPVDGYKGWITFRTRYPGQGTFTNLTVTGDILVEDGVWTHNVNAGVESERLAVKAGGRFLLGTNAVINLSGRGYAAYSGPGAGIGGQRNAVTASGAHHGGRGANGSSVTSMRCYGSPVAPTGLGSGGVSAGGGALRLIVGGEATILSTILASGGTTSSQNPGPAGGSLYLTAGSLSGNGVLDASGTDGYLSGGGGRIAVVLTNGTDFGTIAMRASGGPGAYSPFRPAAGGTIYTESPAGRQLLVDNRGYNVNSTNTYTELPASYDSPAANLDGTVLVITNQGRLALTDYQVVGDLFVRTNSWLYLKGHDLRVKTVYHDDWGTTNRVGYDEGRIIWNTRGTVILIR